MYSTHLHVYVHVHTCKVITCVYTSIADTYPQQVYTHYQYNETYHQYATEVPVLL